MTLWCLGATLASTAAAQLAEDVAATRPASRPRVGLVLAGGGAKGAAHIGVLRVLDELKIPVDCVVGTSMGALVGAVFAAGVSPAELEESVRAVDWARTVGGQGLRDLMPIERKLSTGTYSNSLELGLRNRRLRMPGGLVGTQEIEQVIRTLVASARATRDFDDLPIPYRAIATDMVAGDLVVLDSGDLAAAMRASMAIPGAFSPIVIDGKVLSDGGMMRNLPVDIARELCADVVIAVWMSAPAPESIALDSALTLMQRSLDVMVGANQRASIESLTSDDVGIEVPMGDIGSSDFERVPEAIDLGRAAGERNTDRLRRYSVPDAEYRAWTAALEQGERYDEPFTEVRISGTDRVNPEYVRAQMILTADTPTGIDDVATNIERVYALGDFDRVEYDVTEDNDNGARVLEIEPVEKPWGPNFFRLDFGVATYEGGDIFAILRVDHERTWVNSLGGRWHNALQIGRQSIVTTDFYQPLDTLHQWFVQPQAVAREDIEDVYLDGDRAARYDVRQAYGQVDLGLNVGTRAQLRVGLRTGQHEAELNTGTPGLPELDHATDTSVHLRAAYDTRDSIALPTRGSYLQARYVRSKDWLEGEFDYGLIEAVYLQAFDVRGGDSLSLIAGAADLLQGQLPLTEQIELGGILTFPGLRPGELRGNSYWFAGTSYAWRLFDIQPLFGQALYAGVRFQAGEMKERFDLVSEEVLYGLSGSVGGRTPIGPFLLSLGYVDNGSWQLQFTLGRPIAEGSLLDQIH